MLPESEMHPRNEILSFAAKLSEQSDCSEVPAKRHRSFAKPGETELERPADTTLASPVTDHRVEASP
jgi:hypothetical protein